MGTLLNSLLATIILVLTLILSGAGTILASDSQAVNDTTVTESGNSTITVTQKGSGNSASVSQSGSKAKTVATVTSKGEMNSTEIATGSDVLQTEISFSGESNRLLTLPGPSIRLFSIKAPRAVSATQDFSFTRFYFISKQPDQILHIHQTSDGVRINKSEQ